MIINNSHLVMAVLVFRILELVEKLGCELVYTQSPNLRYVKIWRKDLGDHIGSGDSFFSALQIAFSSVSSAIREHVKEE